MRCKKLTAIILSCLLTLGTGLSVSASEIDSQNKESKKIELQGTESDELELQDAESDEIELQDAESDEIELQDASGTLEPILEPTGIKGIIAETWCDDDQVYSEDPIELGIDHVFTNINIGSVLSTNGTGEAFSYNNKTYYFNGIYNGSDSSHALYYTMLRMKQLREKGLAITVQLNMEWSDDAAIQQLIHPNGRVQGKYCYALNTTTAESRELIAAILHYLVYKMPYVTNWIMDNEANSSETAHYCGTNDLNTNVTLTAQAFNLLLDAINDNSSPSSAFICLDNIWNFDRGDGGNTAKSFLDAFAKLEAGKPWNLAYHPYGVPYGADKDASEWTLWGAKAGSYCDHTENSDFVTGANLDVLLNYMESHYGTSHRVILTELGFDSAAGLEEQAAELYYTYKAAERSDLIDLIVYQPWKHSGWDHRDMGIIDPDTYEHRPIYNVFQYMDSDPELANEDYYLSFLGIASWEEDILYRPISIQGIYIPESDGETIRAGAIIEGSQANCTYECTVIDYDYQKYGCSTMFPMVKKTKDKTDNWCIFTPTHSGTYGFCWRVYDKNGKMISEKGAARQFTLEAPTITGVYIPDPTSTTIKAGAIIKGKKSGSYTYECTVIDYNYKEYGETRMFPYTKTSSSADDNWCEYTPKHPGTYGFCWRIYDKNGNKISEYGAARSFTGDFVSLTGVYIPDAKNGTIRAGAIISGQEVEGVTYTYECTVIDYDYAKYGSSMFPYVKKTHSKDDNWCVFTPTHPGAYGFCWRIYNDKGVLISEKGAARKFA